MGRPQQYEVRLTEEQREALARLIRTGTQPAHTRRRAQILLKVDAAGPDAWSDVQVAKALDLHAQTAAVVRKQFVAEGLDATLYKRKPTGRRSYRKLDGEQEARLIALTCSEPPSGRARWTMKLLADRLVAMEVVESIDPATVCRTLKKNKIKPWLRQEWVIAPKANAAFVANMEDVLDTYARPYDSARPVVCVDELRKQLIGEVREPLPLRPGSPRKSDSEYVRHGTAEIFIAFEPLAGWRGVKISERRTSQDFAHFVQWLADTCYRDAERIVLVCDNLNTHTTAALYEAFDPVEAHRIARRIEWHYTPKHGSWLNVAEMELSVLARQCLDRRIPDLDTLTSESSAWVRDRNATSVKVDWQFTA
ncbi:MAG: IS630 family transposase, partial [Gemmataceae bacterium]